MKTFIINGATNPRGDVAALLAAYTSAASGEILTVGADSGISPCVDCRRCLRESGCAIQDKMSDCYGYIADCDRVVIASPVWFGSLSGPALNIASRIQTLFCGERFRGEKQCARDRRGVLILAGGRAGSEEGAIRSARLIFRYMGVEPERITVVRSMATDSIPAAQDGEALDAARRAARED